MTEQHVRLLPMQQMMETIVDRDGREIASLASGIPLSVAEFIVHACNAHYDLLRACQEVVGNVDAFQHTGTRVIILRNLEAAMAKATE